jgi:hypothetical protein
MLSLEFLNKQNNENLQITREVKSSLGYDSYKTFETFINDEIAEINNVFSVYIDEKKSTLQNNYLTSKDAFINPLKGKNAKKEKLNFISYRLRKFMNASSPKIIHDEISELIQNNINTNKYKNLIEELRNSDKALRFVHRYLPNLNPIDKMLEGLSKQIFFNTDVSLEKYVALYKKSTSRLIQSDTQKKIEKGLKIAGSVGGAIVTPFRGGAMLGRTLASSLLGKNRKISKSMDDVLRVFNLFTDSFQNKVADTLDAIKTVNIGLYGNFLVKVKPEITKVGFELNVIPNTPGIYVTIKEKEEIRRLRVKARYFQLAVARIIYIENEKDFQESVNKLTKLQSWVTKNDEVKNLTLLVNEKEVLLQNYLNDVSNKVYDRYIDYWLRLVKSGENFEFLPKLLNVSEISNRPEIIALQKKFLSETWEKLRELICDRDYSNGEMFLTQRISLFKENLKVLRHLKELKVKLNRVETLDKKIHLAGNSPKKSLRSAMGLKEIVEPEWLSAEIVHYKKLITRKKLIVAIIAIGILICIFLILRETLG